MHVKMNPSTFDVTQITFLDTIQIQDFAEMRGKHLPLRTWIWFLKTDSLFADSCTKCSYTIVTTVLPRSAFVVALGVCSLGITVVLFGY